MAAQLAVALDVPDGRLALALAAKLMPVTPWMKVGLELFTLAGPAMVRELKKRGCRVFLDLKFHDIPNTVRGAVRSALAAGADICNIHLAGGEAMSRAAVAEMAEARSRGRESLLLGVTVLTSTPDQDGGLADLVLERAVNAKAWGLDGVVCSALEAAAVKRDCGPEFICLCPGIRPAAYQDGGRPDDQSRVLTPLEAVRQGADFLVVGRPITRAADPAAAAAEIVASCRLD
ncbi:MAG: orotidine-5'-phosphate decarboxylase [Deltaproteobacteria bacterium]|jgi:orotidine-5'-phosphate decarboxylase|nr:orotidine-5'-phosphate decarboxylase [Deltaproteobacteria bacterium]